MGFPHVICLERAYDEACLRHALPTIIKKTTFHRSINSSGRAAPNPHWSSPRVDRAKRRGEMGELPGRKVSLIYHSIFLLIQNHTAARKQMELQRVTELTERSDGCQRIYERSVDGFEISEKSCFYKNWKRKRKND
ncbi:hypothetical protein H5410_051063 [Solanum commersonii]|uniref:Uncharacterized protein n=1 Tax=Solanum commersonii TaxID=4109 RepID=A0A9J5WZE9_SOLCO|nr:hypothetical protein H5410_051063 [Solanum commersonii]